jgi:hypothetical protein
MASKKTVVLGSVAVLLILSLAVGGEAFYLHHRNAEDAAAPTSTGPAYKIDPDDDVYPKQEHPMSLKDEKDLKGRTLWVSAADQMDYYPYDHGKIDFKSAGVLLGAEPILVKDATEAVAPARTAIRIPVGDKQVFLLFTHANDPKEYATPVGFKKDGDYTFLTDQIYFYDDPHKLYGYWGPQVWAAIDAHKAIPGMSERQTQMALGQVSTPHGDDTGNRTVSYYNNGHPIDVTYVNNKATTIRDAK